MKRWAVTIFRISLVKLSNSLTDYVPDEMHWLSFTRTTNITRPSPVHRRLGHLPTAEDAAHKGTRRPSPSLRLQKDLPVARSPLVH